MKKKILSQFLKVTLIAIVITLFMSVIVFYELFKKQVFHDLKSEAEFARYTIDDLSDEKQFDVRVTWIGTDGNVLYDWAGARARKAVIFVSMVCLLL